ncbi:IclR family transcriptional regulator [Microbacterium sp.]|uniref:IclR family transcriptional regulator n=1 Tax=Microbacterium sp. TaxID=51671 RepID=UPI003A8E5637
MARGSAGESVLSKHLRVLDAFDALRPFLTLAEISDAAALAPSTAHRLVAELEREGLLERLPDRSYRLGVRLWEFASRTPGALGLRELARPWMNAVHSRIAQHTQLGVLNGLDVLFIERMSTRGAVVNATLIGGRIPLAVSSSGLVLLAHAGDDVVSEVIRVGWPHQTRHTLTDGAALRDRLRRVRADGYAVLDGHIYEESRGIAVPVFGPHGGVYAALSVVVPVEEASPAGAIEMLVVAAAGITRSLSDAYLSGLVAAPDGSPAGIGPLVSTSLATVEYFAKREEKSTGELR